MEQEIRAGSGGAEGALSEQEYRVHVGPGAEYDVFSAMQFNLLTTLGLREHHTLLDIGCGSLRAGRLFIPYLRPGHYFGLEPEAWLVKEGIRHELGEEIIRLKAPTFEHNSEFRLTAFGRQFDFMIAQSIFSHTSQSQMRACFEQARKVMKPTSIFAASFFEGDEDYKGDRWVVRANYTMDRMKALVEEQGLKCVPFSWPHPDMQRWILILHPESKFAPPRGEKTQEILALQQELENCKSHLRKFENHPYVKFGMKVRYAMMWCGFLKRRVAREVRSG